MEAVRHDQSLGPPHPWNDRHPQFEPCTQFYRLVAPRFLNKGSSPRISYDMGIGYGMTFWSYDYSRPNADGHILSLRLARSLEEVRNTF